jgi:hypothetical protein
MAIFWSDPNRSRYCSGSTKYFEEQIFDSSNSLTAPSSSLHGNPSLDKPPSRTTHPTLEIADILLPRFFCIQYRRFELITNENNILSVRKLSLVLRMRADVCSHSPGRVGEARRINSSSAVWIASRSRVHKDIRCRIAQKLFIDTHSNQTLIINSRPCVQLLCRCSCCAYNSTIVHVGASIFPSVSGGSDHRPPWWHKFCLHVVRATESVLFQTCGCFHDSMCWRLIIFSFPELVSRNTDLLTTLSLLRIPTDIEHPPKTKKANQKLDESVPAPYH